jgi:mono/diheme cytochrome c family protein
MTRGTGVTLGILALAVVLAAGAVALVLAPMPPSPRGPEPGRTLYQQHCATCHGPDGRGGAWRARLLFLRPGDLASPATATLTDQYLGDIIRHGGATVGKPGMPAFGFILGPGEIDALVGYLRSLPRAPRDVGKLPARPG